MAIDVCSEISSMGMMSPRISFSHDLNQTDVVPTEQYNRRSDTYLLDSNSDFNFCISESFVQEPSSADELFSNGKILPVQIKKKFITIKDIHKSHSGNSPPQPTTTTTTTENAKKKCLKEFLATSSDQEEKNPPSKSFWQFRRSSSLNCDNARSRSLIRSLHFLSRSNSTGSAPNPKHTMLPKNNNQKQQSQKQPPSITSAKSCSSSTYYPYNPSQKPPLKKNCRSYGNGVRISPVLNLPPHYISRGSVSLFGFGSLFCNGKDKKKKK